MTIEEKGFRRILRLRGRTLKVLSGSADVGRIFTATINRIGEYQLQTSLGQDPRGRRTMEVPADSCPRLASQAKLEDQKNGEVFKVTAIGLDCPDYSKKFELAQDKK